jgi:branched-chain amino acid transport system permease protein
MGLFRGAVPFLVVLPVLALVQLTTRAMPFFGYLSAIVGVNVILAVSLNIVNGMTGQFSIGHAGFMAVGAYVAALVSIALSTMMISGIPIIVSDQLCFLVSIAAGGVAAALCGFVVGLPSLRLRGDYLAIVTLGFGEIIRVIVQNTEAVGRALGLSGTPQHGNFLMIWAWVWVTILAAHRIAGSSKGRSLWAIRDDEVAAEAMGIDTTAYKVRAFVVSSFFAGVAGALFAHFVPIVNPGSFTFVKSMEIVVMIVVGGLGSISGAVGAAVVLTLLPEAMRSLFTSGSEHSDLAQRVDQIRMPVYGVLLVLLMLARPQGILGAKEVWQLSWFKRLSKARGR